MELEGKFTVPKLMQGASKGPDTHHGSNNFTWKAPVGAANRGVPAPVPDIVLRGPVYGASDRPVVTPLLEDEAERGARGEYGLSPSPCKQDHRG